MGRKQTDSDVGRFIFLVLLLIAAVSCCMAYLSFSVALRRGSGAVSVGSSVRASSGDGLGEEEEDGCCRGIERLELWGDAVKWGSDFRKNSSMECCKACKEMCKGDDGPCLCNSWVYCADREACGSRFGECWLKKQKDSLDPEPQDSGDKAMWTSGLIFGKGEGIVQLITEYGVLHVKLLPDCAPHSVAYILELLGLRHCAGCQFYRSESRGNSWDAQGNHIDHASFGPPFALIQGTLAAHGAVFKDIPVEVCPMIRRGSIAWVGSGPDFFISLANHHEWRKAYTVFGYVLPEDMDTVEKIAQLPTIPEVWSNINVSVLKTPVSLHFARIKKSR